MSITRDMVVASLGLSRIALFDRTGVEFFPSSKEAASRSFWVPALATPIFLYALLQNLPIFMETIPKGMIFSVFALGVIIMLSGYYLAVNGICNATEKQDLFARYVTINNWAAVLYLVVLSPALFVHVFEIGDVQMRLIFDQIASMVFYVYMWFIARHALNLGGLGAVGMVILFFLIYLISMVGAGVILVQAAGGHEYVQMLMETGRIEGVGGVENGASGSGASGSSNAE